MRKIYIFSLLTILVTVCSCDKLLEVNSGGFVSAEANKLSSPNDSVYSVFGILSEMQKLGDNYVILGELRSELMDVTPYANQDLRDINSLNIAKDNPYIDVSKYYSVINNCDFVIAHMDTLIGKKVLKQDYAAAVAVRAWCYYQLAINYESVPYAEHPIGSIQDLNDNSIITRKTRDEIFDLIITELKSIENIGLPRYKISGIEVKYMIPDAKSTLADIYLWKDDYENAAIYYKKMIESDFGYLQKKSSGIVYNYTGVSNGWSSIFFGSTYLLGSEISSEIFYNPSLGNQSKLTDIFLSSYFLKPSSWSVDQWRSQNLNTLNPKWLEFGDVRGMNGPWAKVSLIEGGIMPFISKFFSGNGVILSRGAYYHLRFAEAVNRLGKPSVALAAINFGLKASVLNDTTLVRRKEIIDKPYYLNFDQAKFVDNLGIRNHAGLNPIAFPTDLTSLQDSMLFVENTIMAESALETAYEGNRWTDLVRVALRRDPILHPEESPVLLDADYLGKAVSKKFEPNAKAYFPFIPTASASDILSKLNSSNKQYWFLPLPE